jgi:transcriptional regulator with XRE-family HTH domain
MKEVSMDISKVIGKQVIQARERLGWRQSELARQLKKPRQQVSLIELGEHQPRAELLCELATTLGVSVDFLLGRTEDSTPPQKPAPKPRRARQLRVAGNFV